MKGSEAFNLYVEKTKDLSNLDLSQLDENERKAFFLNVYNCLVIHGIVEGCNKSMFGEKAGRLFFYRTSSYQIGPYSYSLDDIEHGILRSNKISPIPHSKPQFPESDPRIAFKLATVDPRIHFGLNCGAKGCPPIAVYKAANIDNQLRTAARGFLRNGVVITKTGEGDSATYNVKMSMILNWYNHDFGANQVEVFKWMLPYLSTDTQVPLMNEILAAATDTALPANCTIEYEPYNWATNDNKK